MRDVYEVLDTERYTHRDPKSGRFWDDEKGIWVTEDTIFEEVKHGNTKESNRDERKRKETDNKKD